MDYTKLYQASRILHGKFPFLLLVDYYGDKRQHVAMYDHDFSSLVDAYMQRSKQPYKGRSDSWTVDPVPGLRLATACEGIASAVYSASEIAAKFAWNASGRRLPSRFSAIVKKVQDGEPDVLTLFSSPADIQWYSRVREIRTEWTHHSTIFIGLDAQDRPTLVVRSLRGSSDKIHLREQTLLTVDDLLNWSVLAIEVLDRFVLAAYERFILPEIDLDQSIVDVERDENGFPIMSEPGRMVTVRMTARAYLQQCGFTV